MKVKRAKVVEERGIFVLYFGDEVLTAGTTRQWLDEIADFINVGRDSVR
jgi:hypothetical protein